MGALVERQARNGERLLVQPAPVPQTDEQHVARGRRDEPRDQGRDRAAPSPTPALDHQHPADDRARRTATQIAENEPAAASTALSCGPDPATVATASPTTEPRAMSGPPARARRRRPACRAPRARSRARSAAGSALRPVSPSSGRSAAVARQQPPRRDHDRRADDGQPDHQVPRWPVGPEIASAGRSRASARPRARRRERAPPPARRGPPARRRSRSGAAPAPRKDRWAAPQTARSRCSLQAAACTPADAAPLSCGLQALTTAPSSLSLALIPGGQALIGAAGRHHLFGDGLRVGGIAARRFSTLGRASAGDGGGDRVGADLDRRGRRAGAGVDQADRAGVGADHHRGGAARARA